MESTEEHLAAIKLEVELTKKDVSNLSNDVGELKELFAAARSESREDVHALRNAMIAFTTTIAGTAIATLLAFLTGLVNVSPH